jgi:hypothetical protein
MHLLNIRTYKPTKDKQTYGPYVEYYISEDGKDLYEHEHLFTKRWKILVDPELSVICSAEEDITSLNPPGYHLFEVDELPEDFSIEKHFRFVDGKVLPPIIQKPKLKHKILNALHAILE